MPSPVVLITGCSAGGIGHSLAVEYAAQGCQVYASSRNVETMAGLTDKGIHTIALDVTSEESIQGALKKVLGQAGRIDILVNNAGVGGVLPFVDTDTATVRRIFETNVFGVFALSRAVAQHMMFQRSGKIVFVGSVACHTLNPFIAAYASSKAAVQSLCHSLRMELKPFGIQVMHVAPGMIRTHLSAKAGDWSIEQWEASRYGAVVPHIKQDLLTGTAENPNATPPEKFARRMVTATLKRRIASEFSYGYASGIVRFMARCLPRWLTDAIFYSRFAMRKLEASASRT